MSARRRTQPRPQPGRGRVRPEPEAPLPRAALAASITAALSVGVYLFTLAPTVLNDDSGELVTVAHVLGISHPTGYPVYFLAAKLFDLLPFATPPVRVGLFSVACAAAASAGIAWAAAKLTDSAPAGLLAGLVAAFNGPMWSQATQVEVYALNALVVALAILVFVRWSATRRPRELVWLALIAGIGLAHHRTAIFFTAPMLIAVIALGRPRAKLLFKAALAGLAPLLCYLYLPIRAAARPPVMWTNLTDWSSFVTYMLGGGYREYVFARPAGEAADVAGKLLAGLSSELTLGGLALALIGLVSLLRRRRAVSVVLLVCVSLLTIWNLGYWVDDWQVFFIPCILAAGLWAGAGLAAAVSALRRVVGSRLPRAHNLLAAAILVLVPISLLQYNWSKASHRNEWEHYDAFRAIFAQIEPHGIYVTDRDRDLFVPMYLQIVEGERPDIFVISAFGTYDTTVQEPLLRPALPQMISHFTSIAASLTSEGQAREAARFAGRVAETVGGTRPVYCAVSLPGPPTDVPVVALWSDLYHITQERPELLAPEDDGRTAADFDRGVSLVRVAVEPQTVRPGDLLRMRLDWRCAQELQETPFVLLSLAQEDDLGNRIQPDGMLLKYATWLAYGVAPLPPTPPGSVYRQEVIGVAPTGMMPGRWRLWVGLGTGPDEGIAVLPVAEFEALPLTEPGA